MDKLQTNKVKLIIPLLSLAHQTKGKLIDSYWKKI